MAIRALSPEPQEYRMEDSVEVLLSPVSDPALRATVEAREISVQRQGEKDKDALAKARGLALIEEWAGSKLCARNARQDRRRARGRGDVRMRKGGDAKT